MSTSSIVSKVWSFCNPLRDVGVGYGDYLEQLTYLLFLKMADEYTKPPHSRNMNIPAEYNWDSLTSRKGGELELHYATLLRELSTQKGILGQIFTKSQNKIQDPAMLAKIIDMIDKEQWLVMGADVKGDIYERLLILDAEENKKLTGQVFLPQPLMKTMVECLNIEPNKTVADPYCGTGRLFIAAYNEIIKKQLDRDSLKFLKFQTFKGWEVSSELNRLGLMNCVLNHISDFFSEQFIQRQDPLSSPPSETFDYVICGPPFGKKSSQTFTNAEGEQEKMI